MKHKINRRVATSARNYWKAINKKYPASMLYLIRRLDPSSSEVFPFEQALSLYLLFVAALWPSDSSRIPMAARLFAASLNYSVSTLSRKSVFIVNKEEFAFHNHFSQPEVALFNKTFFKEAGGPASLLFTDSVAQFQTNVLKRAWELQMMHDVINFLMKASVVSSKLSSSRLAFEAVASNFFERKYGYGVHGGAKRKRSAKSVSTVQSVREKWKRAPGTVLLSFLLTQILGLQILSLADPKALAYLQASAKRAGRLVTVMLRILQRNLAQSRPSQNKSIEKWTKVLPEKPFNGAIGGALTFSDAEIEHVFQLCHRVFKVPLSDEEKHHFRKNNNSLSGRRDDPLGRKVK